MKKMRGLFLTVFVLVMLAACGNNEQPVNKSDEMPQPLQVDLTVTEQVEVNGAVNMAALVTQGDEKVEDASEVVFEIWEEGKKEESSKIDAVNEKEGMYTAETSFDHDGLFHVQVHVTARDMHTMPLKEVTVGNGGHYEDEEAPDHAHAEGFSMHFTKLENVKAGEPIDLSVHLEMDGAPLEKARVRYEIWDETNPEQHDWVDVGESAAGEYVVDYTFAGEGKFTIQIHVEDDQGLHEHEEHQLDIGKE